MTAIEPPSPLYTLARKFACLGLLLIAAIATTQAQQPDSARWKLTWSDEFNAPNGHPTHAKWTSSPGGNGFGNNEQETYTARPGQYPATRRQPRHHSPQRRPYRPRRDSPELHLRPHQHYKITSRKSLDALKPDQAPPGKGIWPAFWLLGNDHETHPWPDCGEIDILESHRRPGHDLQHDSHGPGYSGRPGPLAKFVLPGQQIDTAFHLYAVEWTPNDIRFYLDDHLIVPRTPADSRQTRPGSTTTPST